MVQPADLRHVAEQAAAVAEAELVDNRRQLLPQAAVAGNQQPRARELGGQLLECPEEQREVLLRLQPPHRANHHLVRAAAERRPRVGFTLAPAAERRGVDAVQDHRDVPGVGARGDQGVLDFARHRDDAREPREQPPIARIVEAAFFEAVPGPAVGGRQRDDRLDARDEQRQEVALVVVRVNDVDAALADQGPRLAPRARIERVPLADLDVVDGQRSRPLIDVIDLVAQVAQVADGDGVPVAIGARRAEQDRLLRTAAGPAHAAELEHAKGVPRRHLHPPARSRRVR